MLKLKDRFDNFIIINPRSISSFQICELPSNAGLGIEISMNNGDIHQVVEPLITIASKLKDLNIDVV